MTSGEATVLLCFIGACMTSFGGVSTMAPNPSKHGRTLVMAGMVFMLPAAVKLWSLAVMG